MSKIKRLFTIRMWTEETISSIRLENILKDELKSDLISIDVEFTGEDFKEGVLIDGIVYGIAESINEID